MVEIDEDIMNKCENLLDNFLSRGSGRFAMEKIVWGFGIISMGTFRKFLKLKVSRNQLRKEKDDLGIVYYSRIGS